MARRRACDRCHEQKQKCIVGKSEQQCDGCVQAGRNCILTRSRLRQGRQPKIQQFASNVVVHVWDFNQIPDNSTLTPQSFGTPGSEDSNTSLPLRSDGPTTKSTSPASPTSTSNLKILINTIHSSTRRFKHGKEQLFDPDTPEVISRFFSHYEIFLLGPSFTVHFRNSIRKLYTCSPELLHDIIIELETALPTIPNADEKIVDFTTGSTAVQDLRTVEPSCIEHAFAIVGLGQVLAAFDLMTGCTGAESIVRSSLISIKSWIPGLLTDSLCASVVIGAIFWETSCCLFRGEVPAVRYEPVEAGVHRIAGLCTSLLPLLYDLCVTIAAIVSGRDKGIKVDTVMLNNIEKGLQQWKPSYPPHFVTTFSREEIVKMETQAWMYRDTALILANRAVHPYGSEDETAGKLARSIVERFNTAAKALDRKTGLNLVSFPILLAALEIEDLTRDVWQEILLSAATPVWIDKACIFVDYAWQQRRCGRQKYLHEMISEGPTLVVIP